MRILAEHELDEGSPTTSGFHCGVSGVRSESIDSLGHIGLLSRIPLGYSASRARDLDKSAS